MRTKAASWILIVAAFPLAAVGCGDDTGATTTSTSSNDDDGEGGSDGDGGGGGSTTSTTTSSTTTSTTTSSTSTGGEGGQGGQGGDGGQGGGDGCGNGLIDGDEVCDGDALGDATCEGEGFVGGTLACNATCDGFDTSACTTCGDGVADPGDACDGSDLGDGTCQSEGFDAGTLGCNDDCTFDTSACVDFSCGDGVRNGDEDCEGGDLGGGTCESVGFALGGTLGCTATCQYDTAACNTCGDDVVNGDDVCDGTALGGSTCTTLGMGFTGGTLGCADGCAAFDTAGCTSFALPAAGQVVITEIMEDPTALADDVAEWFEIHNPSATDTYQLNGCMFVGTGAANDMFTIGVDLTIEPGGYLTFARTASPGFTPDFVWPAGMQLANAADGIALSCAGVEVDSVEYDTAAGWPNPVGGGASMSLDADATNTTDNDDPASWCSALTASASFTSGDRGSPGEANPPCAADLVIGSCRLQFPPTFTAEEGTVSQAIYGRVSIAGYTDVDLTGNDAIPGLIASVGYGPDGSDPTVDASGWSFTAAAGNDAYGVASPGFVATEDEWVGTFTVPADEGSPYDYAFRFSGDGGVTWTYCDLDGSANGYAAAQAGALVSEPSSQTFNLIFSEYIEGTSNNKALEITNLGADVDVNGCDVLLFSNGAAFDAPTNTYNMVGTLAAGESIVLCNASEVDFGAACDVDTNVTNFNGDDALAIVCNAAIVDSFGQIGTDPGTAWGAGVEDTVDVVLRRECAVVSGDSNGSDAFDPATDWVGETYASATAAADLGMHVCP